MANAVQTPTVMRIQCSGTAATAAAPPIAQVEISTSKYSFATTLTGLLGSVNPEPGITLTLWFRNAVANATKIRPVDSHHAALPKKTVDHTPAAAATPLNIHETLAPTVTSEAALATAATASIATAACPPPSPTAIRANDVPAAACLATFPSTGGLLATAAVADEYNAHAPTAAKGMGSDACVAEAINTNTAPADTAAAKFPGLVESNSRTGNMV